MFINGIIIDYNLKRWGVYIVWFVKAFPWKIDGRQILGKTEFLVGSFGRKPLPVILAVILLLASAPPKAALSQTNEADKLQIIRQVAQDWIEIGTEQYNRGLYGTAEQSLLWAWDYQGYLTAAERKKLNELLEKTHTAVLKRQRILETIQTAEALARQGQPIKAKAHLKKAKAGKFLTADDRRLIAEKLKEIDNQLNEQKKEVAELHKRSVELYRAGQFSRARKGFIKVAQNGLLEVPAGETAEDYLVKIDSILGRQVEPSLWIEEAEPAEQVSQAGSASVADRRVNELALGVLEDELAGIKPEPVRWPRPQISPVKSEADKLALVGIAEPVPNKSSIEKANRKRDIRRSYARAVVKDAVTKAQNYVSQGKFYKAKEAVETAEQAISENHPYLGDELFRQYNSLLRQLNKKIVSGRARWLGDWGDKSD